ncbi:Protein will die slowly [Porphyridium purpureum]|uniref:Protein will die slowly n=1 Tax=Porphyridium purpureum TaxID=35688 RepID=A0A5J4ZBI8_PORPP|nr:Protein will die slowly [Porphyridium purpureum]|eukprot:POR6643..scf295_1
MAAAQAGAGSLGKDGGEAYYKSQLEILWREKKQLNERLETLERENRDLRRSVYELSVRRSVGTAPVFDLDAALSRAQLDDDAKGGAASGSMAGGKVGVARDAQGKLKPASLSASKLALTFSWKFDLTGHAGAVYVVQFSPCGRFLTTGSFDHSLRVWSIAKSSDSSLAVFADAHQANIVATAWSADSSVLVSGSYDHTVKEWDVMAQRQAALASYHADGLVQTVAISQQSDELIYAGTSRKKIHVFDRRRKDGNAMLIQNDCMVNAISLQRAGTRLISGDHAGALKTWDVRKLSAEPLSVIYNEEEHRPITHVLASPAFGDEEDGRYLSVNSYDNFLRVYDRGHMLWGSAADSNMFKPLHAFLGPINRSWPIRSSFFRADNTAHHPRGGELDDDVGIDDDGAMRGSADGINTAAHQPVLLASGSADGNAYVFEVGSSETARQILRGHTDRVYCTSFHPTDPILATCSADHLVKIWGPAKTTSL